MAEPLQNALSRRESTDISIDLTINWRGHSETVTFEAGSTASDLSKAITERLSIPGHAQKLIVRGLGLIKPGLRDSELALTLLAGKNIRLLGCPEQELQSLREATTAHREGWVSIRDRQLETIRATERLRQKYDMINMLVRAGIQQQPGASANLLSRYQRYHGGTAPDFGRMSAHRLETLIGTGTFPRIDCHHLRGISEDFGCKICRSLFFLDWLVFAKSHLQDLASRAIKFANASHNTAEKRACWTFFEPMQQRLRALANESEAETALFKVDVFMYELELMEGDLHYDTDDDFFVEHDDPEEVDKDLDSLTRMLAFLSGEESFGYENSEEDEEWEISLEYESNDID